MKRWKQLANARAFRVIVDDHGVDIAGGVSFFQRRHRETVEIYDTKHKAACLLKSRLEKNARWQEFQQRIAQTHCSVQQTEMSFLVPNAPKAKAHFMNFTTLQWAENVLAVLRQPPTVVSEQVSRDRLEEKLGWLRVCEADVAEWTEWQQVADVTVEFVNRQGIYRGVARQLRTELRPHREYSSSRSLAGELLAFVAKQARRARPEMLSGEHRGAGILLWALKQIEKQQARGGFTSLVLAFGALLAETTTQAIEHAMHQSPTKAIIEWCAENLGTTLFSRRKQAFAVGATKVR